MTVSGIGFGQKSPAAPFLWDTLENQMGYAGLRDESVIPKQSDGCDDCPWPSGGSYNVYYNSEGAGVRVPGRPNYKAHKSGNLGGLEINTNPDKPVMYINWWVMATKNLYNHGNGFVYNKLLRAWPNSSGTAGRTSWEVKFTMGWIDAEGTNKNYYYGGRDGILIDNQWANLEATINSAGIGPNGGGKMTLDMDNNRVLNTPNELASLAGPYDRIVLIGSDPNQASKYDDDTYVYFGDIYVDNTLARVMVGNASTFSQCTHTEIQIPVTWQDNQITFTSNNGTLNTGDQVWLYVFDEDGNHNATGFPVSGVGGGDDVNPVLNVGTMETIFVELDENNEPVLIELADGTMGERHIYPGYIALAGTASDNTMVSQVMWSNNKGLSGVASGTTSWNIEVPLHEGINEVTVTVTDYSGNSTSETLTVEHYFPGQPGQPGLQ